MQVYRTRYRFHGGIYTAIGRELVTSISTLTQLKDCLHRLNTTLTRKPYLTVNRKPFRITVTGWSNKRNCLVRYDIKQTASLLDYDKFCKGRDIVAEWHLWQSGETLPDNDNFEGYI